MKLAAIYNFFNGEEHLIQSLHSVRSSCEYVCIIAQRNSNIGNQMSASAFTQLETAQRLGLVDEIHWYRPNLQLTARKNELQKRRVGLSLAKRNKCSHFFTIDADEFYRPDELQRSKALIIERNLNSTSVSSYFHVKRPKYRFLDTTNVAFITKLGFFTKLGDGDYPIENIDSTRKVRQLNRRHQHFGPDVVAMYHMNLVRKDFRSKFSNTSTKDQAFLDAVAHAVDNYTGEHEFNFPKKGTFQLLDADNEFETFDPCSPTDTSNF